MSIECTRCQDTRFGPRGLCISCNGEGPVARPEPPCKECEGAVLVERPNAFLPDGRPQLRICPSCLGSGRQRSEKPETQSSAERVAA